MIRSSGGAANSAVRRTPRKTATGATTTARLHGVDGRRRIPPGTAHGATDEFGHQAIAGKVHMHDLHATILHQLGLDHERLTYRYAGRDFRLTDVSGGCRSDRGVVLEKHRRHSTGDRQTYHSPAAAACVFAEPLQAFVEFFQIVVRLFAFRLK